MMRLLLLRFWPVLLPGIVYWLWLRAARRKGTIDGKPLMRFRDGPWYWMVIASLMIALACFIFLGTESLQGGKGDYTPPHMENGEVVPGHVSEKP